MEFELKSQILGFDDIKKIKLEKIDDLFSRATNAEGPFPSWILANPFLLRDYDFEIPDAQNELLQIDKETNMLVFNIVVIQKPLDESLVNFIAPLVFNVDKKIVMQVVLDSNKYGHFGVLEPIKTFMNR